MRTLIVVLALLMIPLVQAQGAEPTVAITAQEDTLIVSRESDATMTFNVRFESDNPFDGLQPREVRIDHSASPAGWSITLSPRSVELMAGDSATVTATVTLGASAEESEVPVTFTAQLVPRGAEDTPIGGQIDPQAEGSVDITMKREDPLTREVLEGVGGWIWLVLGGVALLAIALAVILSRRNKATVAMTSNVGRATVAPGRSVAVPVMVENLQRTDDTVVFHVAPVPSGWAASLPVPELPLDGRRREELHLVVTAPKDAKPGSDIRVGLSASTARAPGRVAELIVQVVVGDTDAKKAAGDTTPDQ